MNAPAPQGKRGVTFGSLFAGALILFAIATSLMYAWGAEVAKTRAAPPTNVSR